MGLPRAVFLRIPLRCGRCYKDGEAGIGGNDRGVTGIACDAADVIKAARRVSAATIGA